MSVLLSEDRGHIRILTMNRPEALNACNMELYSKLVEAFEAADADDNVRVVILTGAGRSFCAGADTREFENLTPENEGLVSARAELTYKVNATLPKIKKTVIAAVHGHAVGGGAGLAMACDIAVADRTTKIGYPEIRHGLVAAVVMANLVKQMGQKQAYTMLVEGLVHNADDAQRLGMVTYVVDEGKDLERALELAEKLASRVPQALQATKVLFKQVCDAPLGEGQLLGRAANEAMRAYRADAIKAYKSSVTSAKSEITAA